MNLAFNSFQPFQLVKTFPQRIAHFERLERLNGYWP